MNRVAIDFETYYDKEHGISGLGVRNYVYHRDTDIYLVALYGGEGKEFVGSPSDAPWEWLNDATVLAHNMKFDGACMDRLKLEGVIPEDVRPKELLCTADMCAYLSAPRNLAGACKELLSIEVSKAVRSNASGKRWPQDFDIFEQEDMLKYGTDDAKLCYQLFDKFGDDWPISEREYSQHTSHMCRRGIGIDTEALEDGLRKVKQAVWECGQEIPWNGETDKRGKPLALTSPKMINEYCAKAKIPVPSTTAKKEEEWVIWEEKYGAKAPFVKAVGNYRSANRVLKVLEKMKNFSHNDRLFYGLKYFGAHTGRWSGDAGLNMQNFPQKAIAGVDLRSLLVPAKGKQFIVADYSQIEARVLPWLVGDKNLLDLISKGMDIYEAHARSTMGYEGERPLKDVDNDMRQLAKCRVLALGFGLGSEKFKSIAKMWANIDLTPTQAKETVTDFRKKNKGIVNLWNRLDKAFKSSALEDKHFELELPSGRVMHYYDVSSAQGFKARTQRGGTRKYLYGGLLTENLVQATARDILASAVLKLEKAGCPVVAHIHDEVICEVPKYVDPSLITDVMCELPSWAKGLPLDADAQILERYTK